MNADGISQADELSSLAHAGVVSIDLGAQAVSWWQAGHEVRLASSVDTLQASLAIVDVWFEVFDDPARITAKDAGNP